MNDETDDVSESEAGINEYGVEDNMLTEEGDEGMPE